MVAGSEPGALLGGLVIVGTAAAALAVDRGAVYVIIPVPALAYLGGALTAGLVHDRAIDTSVTALVINAAQWAAGGLVSISIATGLAIALTAARWPWGRRSGREPQWEPDSRPERPRAYRSRAGADTRGRP